LLSYAFVGFLSVILAGDLLYFSTHPNSRLPHSSRSFWRDEWESTMANPQAFAFVVACFSPSS